MPSVYCSGVICDPPPLLETSSAPGLQSDTNASSGGERGLDVRAVFVREALEVDADAAAGIAVDDLAVADQVAPAQGDAQREHRAFGNLRARVYVEAAGAYVLGRGDAGQVVAVEEHVD